MVRRSYLNGEGQLVVESTRRDSEESRALTWHTIYGNREVDIDGRSLSAQTALKVSAVYACVNVIAQTIASLPLHLHRRVSDKETQRERRHRTAGWLSDAPNGKMTWPEAREALMASLILRGNGFGRVRWVAGYPIQLDPLCVDQVTVSEAETRLQYAYYPASGEEELLAGPSMLHVKALSFDGILGLSPLTTCSYAFTRAKAQAQHGVNVFSNGARLTGILTIPFASYKNEDVRKAMRKEWETQIKHAREGSGTAMLTENVAYSPISMSLADAQFIETEKLSVEEIARIFRVPLHKIQHLEHATFSNIEHQSVEFLQDTILPWLTKLEHSMDRVLLTERDRRDGLFFRHNVEGILRGDYLSRMQGHQIAVITGIKTRNEARAHENDPPLPGGDVPLVPLNMGGTPPPDAKPIRSLDPVRPIILETSRAMQERITKAVEKSRGKADEVDRLEKFFEDHERALRQRLPSLLQSIESLGYQGAQDQLDGIVQRSVEAAQAYVMGAGAKQLTDVITETYEDSTS